MGSIGNSMTARHSTSPDRYEDAGFTREAIQLANSVLSADLQDMSDARQSAKRKRART